MDPVIWCDYFHDTADTRLMSAVMHMGMDGWDDAEFEPESFVSRDHAGPRPPGHRTHPSGTGFRLVRGLLPRE